MADPAAWTVWLVRGVEPPTAPTYLPPGFTILAATPEAIEALGTGALPGGPVTIMDDVRTALAFNGQTFRSELGAYAAGGALGLGDLYLRRLLDAIWIATGVMPAPFLKYSIESATYPAFRASMERFPAEQAGRDPGGEAQVETLQDRVVGVFARHHFGHDYWWSDHEDDEDFATARGLRAVAGLADALAREADGALSAMLAFAMADGLLRDRDESYSVVSSRLALLLGPTVEERRALRRQFTSLEEIRDSIAHGSRPDVHHVERFLGTLDEPADDLFGDVLSPLRNRGRDIGRRLLAAALFLTWDLGEPDELGTPSLAHRMHRSEYLSVLAQAQAGEPDALVRVESWLPDWVRFDPTSRA